MIIVAMARAARFPSFFSFFSHLAPGANIFPEKFSALALLFLLSACLGESSGVPVIYHHPDVGTTYHNNPSSLPSSRIQFSVEFPEGLPNQGNTLIELNGVDITDEFDDWGVSQINVASLALGGGYDALSYPKVANTLRAGVNSFQVREPVEKSLIFFQVDLAGAGVFITEWHDTYCGYSEANEWLVPWRMNDNCVVDTVSGKQVNPNTQSQRHANARLFVRGYVEDNTAEGFDLPWLMEIKRYRVNNNGVRTLAAWNPVMNRHLNDGRWGDSEAGIPIASGENRMYGYFGASGAMCNYFLKYMIDPQTGAYYTPEQYQVTTDLAANEFCAYIPDNDTAGNDMDAIEFAVTDNMGVYRILYLRSHVPVKDSRLDKSSPSTIVAGVGVRVGEDSIISVLDTVANTLEVSGNLLQGNPVNIVSLFGVTVRLSSLYLPELDLDYAMPNTPGRLNVHTRINGTRATITQSSNCGFLNLICHALSAALSGGVTAIVSGDIYMNIDVDVYDASHPDSPNEVYTGLSMNIPNMSIALDLGSGIGASILEAIINPLIGFLDAFIVNLLDGLVSGIVEGIVNDVFAVDLPKLRLAVPSVDVNGLPFRQYLALRPEVEYLNTSASSYDVSEMGLDIGLGFHTRGNPRINKSPGAVYDDSAQLMDVRMARTVTGTNAASAGLALSSNFINQLMMGLWESGILGLRFNTGNNQSVNTFLNNANIRFFSATPWSLDLIPDGEPEAIKGNAKVIINDLLISFRGDIYDPFRGRWFYDRTFFEMNVFLEAFVTISADGKNLKIEFSSLPVAYLDDFNSDYIPVSRSFANGVLQDLMPILADEVQSMSLALPPIQGMNIEFRDIWVEDPHNMALTFDITVQ